jgi:hypothetical protein
MEVCVWGCRMRLRRDGILTEAVFGGEWVAVVPVVYMTGDGVGMGLDGDGGGGVLPVATTTAAAGSCLQVVQGQVRKEHGRAGSAMMNLRRA